MSENYPRETRRLSEEDKHAIEAGMELIARERKEMEDKDPREFVLGITQDGALLSVDELYGADAFEDGYFVIRHGRLEDLAAGQPLERQTMSYLGVTRYRDGGTTIMPTQFGEIFSPAPHRGEPITLDGAPISPLSSDGEPNPAA